MQPAEDGLYPGEPVGRENLLVQLEEALRTGGRAALIGAAGSGKTTVAAALEARAKARRETVLRITAHPPQPPRPQVVACPPPPGAAGLAAQAPLGTGRAPEGTEERRPTAPKTMTADAAQALLAALRKAPAPGAPMLLILDDAQWLVAPRPTAPSPAEPPAHHPGSDPRGGTGSAADGDTATSDPLRQALARPLPPGLRLLVLGRPPAARRIAQEICGVAGVRTLPLPPLDDEGITELLIHRNLPIGPAGRIHRASGGNPRLALALAGSAADSAPATLCGESAVRGPAGAAARELLAAVSGQVRRTLLRAALASRPTVGTIRRSGRHEAEGELAAAEAAGLVTVSVDGRVAFTAGLLPAALAADADPAERAACHAELATAVDDPLEVIRHRALTVDYADGELAVELTAAAAAGRRRGDGARAAELGLLAAERTPADRPAAALARLVAAAGDAGRAGRPDLARRAADAILARDASPADRVWARLAIADTAGQGLAGLDEIYTQALADAGDDPRLRAAVQLRLTWKLLLSDGDPVGARQAAVEAGTIAAAEGDHELAAMALTARARMGRILGDPDAERVLAEAQALEASVVSSGLHNSARILAIRHALFDDRLAEARARLLALLPTVERAGMAEDLIEVLRTLSETSSRWGRCKEALNYARRAITLTNEAGLSPGPARFTAAMAESAGGRFDRAMDHARRGVWASEKEQDQMFLARNLYALGRTQLVSGDPRAAVRTLSRVGELGIGKLIVDPSMLRWQEELAEALVHAGDLEHAEHLLGRVRPTAERLGRHSVLAALDRAEALLAAAAGSTETAVELLGQALSRFSQLELPLERGRTLLALAAVDVSRGEPELARSALREAARVFTRTNAAPWLELADRAAAG
ncbi:AAA family ATPase [Streptomyces sp. TP-A0874]|uniref:AAA family ATPase n=1 Tax=Streptomyces sp. TP-A0874 TaxID=549819 RepID=UPI0008528ED6|nr:AAA family ATPase [Streptomyces sp. TP-A0874]